MSCVSLLRSRVERRLEEDSVAEALGAALIRPVRECLDFCPNAELEQGSKEVGWDLNSGLHAC